MRSLRTTLSGSFCTATITALYPEVMSWSRMIAGAPGITPLFQAGSQGERDNLWAQEVCHGALTTVICLCPIVHLNC